MVGVKGHRQFFSVLAAHLPWLGSQQMGIWLAEFHVAASKNHLPSSFFLLCIVASPAKHVETRSGFDSGMTAAVQRNGARMYSRYEVMYVRLTGA
jgi:hypothetical protein